MDFCYLNEDGLKMLKPPNLYFFIFPKLEVPFVYEFGYGQSTEFLETPNTDGV